MHVISDSTPALDPVLGHKPSYVQRLRASSKFRLKLHNLCSCLSGAYRPPFLLFPPCRKRRRRLTRRRTPLGCRRRGRGWITWLDRVTNQWKRRAPRRRLDESRDPRHAQLSNREAAECSNSSRGGAPRQRDSGAALSEHERGPHLDRLQSLASHLLRGRPASAGSF